MSTGNMVDKQAAILVSGATSFIGLKLCERLLQEGFSVIAVCRKDSPRLSLLQAHQKLRLVHADMSEYKKLDKLVNQPCTAFFSLAWNGTRASSRDDEALQKSNFDNSLDGLECALKLGCTQIISAGSQAEYGLHAGPVSEESPCKPVTAYGRNKLAFYEEALKICSQTASLKEPRFFSLYGKEDSQETMIISILTKMLTDLVCDLTECIQIWDFLHIDDAIDGLLALMNTDCPSGAYNFGSGDARPLRSFIEEMYRLTGSASQLNFGALAYPKTGMVHVQPNITKMRNYCAWSPKINFEAGICSIIPYLKRSLS